MYRPRTIIFVLAITAFFPILRVGFLWDDHVMIENNPRIQTWSVQALKQDFSSDMFLGQGDPYFRPIQVMTNRIDTTLWGLRPLGHHITQLLIHAANALLFYELLMALGATLFAALAAASLFAVHPIIIEEMMIIAGRGEILSLLFMLASLLCLLKKDRKSQMAGVLLYGGALLTKESAIVLPALLALLYYVKRRPARDYAILLALGLITLPYLALRRHAVGPVPFSAPLSLLSCFYFLAFPKVLFKYLGLLIFPWNLHSHRLMPHLSPWAPYYLAALFMLVAVLLYRDRRVLLAGLGWYVICLVPKTPVMMMGNFMLDHWIYPSRLAYFTGIAWLLIRGWESPKLNVRRFAGALYGFLIIALSLMTHVNVELRGTDEKMYRWALHFTTSNPIKYNLGLLLVQTGRAKEALPYFEDVRHSYPEDLSNINALAMAYSLAGYPKASLILLERAHQQYPNHELTTHNLNHVRSLMAKSRS